MFGYINANRNELSEEDKIAYQRYYCGLCQKLHEIAGFKGQLLLNYDLAFLVILFSGLYEEAAEEKEFRCIIHPVSKKHAYINEATAYAADMDIILSYHSFLDNVEDDGSAISQVAAKSLKKQYEEIKLRYPRQVKAVEEYIKKLSEAEKRGEKNVDLVANFTGEMMACLFNWKEDMFGPDLEKMGFYMGKYIYILDAYDDLKKDEKKGHYNPLSYIKNTSNDDFETFVRCNLTALMAECAKSFERLPIIENATILRNIIYSGVWTKYEYIQLKEKTKETKEKS